MVSNFSRGLDGVTGAQYVLNLGFTPNAGYLQPQTPAQAGDEHMRATLKAMKAPASFSTGFLRTICACDLPHLCSVARPMPCCAAAVAGSLALQNEQHVPANSSIGLMQVIRVG